MIYTHTHTHARARARARAYHRFISVFDLFIRHAPHSIALSNLYDDQTNFGYLSDSST